MNCNPKSSYEIPGDLILEPFLTTINDRTSKNIEDAWTKMVETFNNTKPCKVEPQAKILKEDKQVDTRLAQLGIDNSFELKRLKDGGVEYRPHEFCFCECIPKEVEEQSSEVVITYD